jgi:hypothetical protein
MSSTQATHSSSNFQLIVDALADYAKLTGMDLSNSPFAERLEHSNSPQTILELLQEREKAFIEYRNRNRRLINCISPAVEVLHTFSGAIGEAAGLVSDPCYQAIFYSFETLLRSLSHLQRPSLSGLTLSLLYAPQTFSSTNFPVTHEYYRLPVGSRQAMTLLWISLNA